MKNKKTGILLTICTLVLCIGITAFGVYAAVKGTLNVNGQLGFTMHDCIVEISGTVKNLAVSDETTTYAKTDRVIEKFVMGSETSTTTNSLDMGELYFYKGLDVDGVGKIFDIVFELDITNLNLSSRMLVTIEPSDLPDGVTIAEEDYYTYLPYKSYFDAGESKKVNFALRLDPEASLTTAVDFDIDMSFESTETTTPSYFTYEENVGWYVAMGTNPYSIYGEPLKWIPFATNNAVTTYKTSPSSMIAFNNKTTEPTYRHTYYFLSQYLLDPDESNAYMNYNSYVYTNASSSSTGSATYYASYYDGAEWQTLSVNANDYASSNIRAYLTAERDAYYSYAQYTSNSTGATAYADTTKIATPFMQQFGISTSDTIYKQINARNNTSLYSDSKSEDSTTKSGSTPTSITMSINGTSKTISSSTTNTFWLPSVYEMYNYWGNAEHGIYDSDSIYVANTLKGKSADLWWLRTPYSGYANYAWYVDSDGCFIDDVVDYGCGVRPAFQLWASV